jgi:hypothetical protein
MCSSLITATEQWQRATKSTFTPKEPPHRRSPATQLSPIESLGQPDPRFRCHINPFQTPKPPHMHSNNSIENPSVETVSKLHIEHVHIRWLANCVLNILMWFTGPLHAQAVAGGTLTHVLGCLEGSSHSLSCFPRQHRQNRLAAPSQSAYPHIPQPTCH